jgi:hypothetical protein
MSLLSKLTLGAAAVLGVYALKGRRDETDKVNSVSSPHRAAKRLTGAAAKRRPTSAKRRVKTEAPAKAEASAKARPKKRAVHRTKAKGNSKRVTRSA